MGLDQYLTRKTYVTFEQRKNLHIDIEGVDSSKISYIEEEVGYWRKANQIHRWFAEKVQDGVDDCGTYNVSKEQLKELLDLAKEVQANPELAKKELPRASGFFFGSTEYDEYYLSDINDTIAILTPILEREKDWGCYYYRASW